MGFFRSSCLSSIAALSCSDEDLDSSVMCHSVPAGHSVPADSQNAASLLTQAEEETEQEAGLSEGPAGEPEGLARSGAAEL